MKRILLPLIAALMIVHDSGSQEVGHGHGYQTVMMTNPAFAGSEGDGILRFSYLNFYPGRSYNLHSFYVSYDSFFPVLHGGAALFVSDDYSGGIINDTRGGFSYSYHLKGGEGIFINAGLGASFFHRGFNRQSMIFPDQIDPFQGVVYQTAEQSDFRGRTVFDVAAGFVMSAGRYLSAVSVEHLAQPDLSGAGSPEERIRRKATIHLSGSFPLDEREKLILRPVISGYLQGADFRAGAGAVFETTFFSLNAMLLINKAEDVDLQTGISFIRENFFVFYSYSFNLLSGNSLLPPSLFQHAGMGIRLNYVDKRKTVNTINFPKL